MRDIEKERPRRVCDIDCAFSCETKAHVVFRQHHMGNAPPVFRLRFTDPEQFRQSEVGERGIAGQLDQALGAEEFVEFPALFFAALVTPDDGTANDLVGGIEQNRTVHLAGEANTGDLIAADTGSLKSPADRDSRGSPPVLRILLRPARLRA